MSILNHLYLIEKYGLRLTLDQLAEVLDTTPIAVRRRIHDGSLGVSTYIEGKQRFADSRDVADYLDTMRDAARRANPQGAIARTA